MTDSTPTDRNTADTITRNDTAMSEFQFTARRGETVIAVCRDFDVAMAAFKCADRKHVVFVVEGA